MIVKDVFVTRENNYQKYFKTVNGYMLYEIGIMIWVLHNLLSCT